MMVNELYQRGLRLEKGEAWGEAIKCYQQVLETTPDDPEVLLHLAVCFSGIHEHEQALDTYVKCYQHSLQTEEFKKRILEYVWSTYYKPNETVFKTIYEKNLTYLKAYEHNYLHDLPAFDELPYFFIPASEDKFFVYDKENRQFMSTVCLERSVEDSNDHSNCVVLIINTFAVSFLENLIHKTALKTYDLNSAKAPIYLIWEDTTLRYLHLSAVDYSYLIRKGSLVFFDSHAEGGAFVHFLLDHQAIIPNQIIGDEKLLGAVNQVIRKVTSFRNRDYESNLAEVKSIYRSIDRRYYQSLFKESPEKIRILFLASRFSQFVQFCTRDLMQACRELGMTCELFTDKSEIHRALDPALIEKITEFKPNIIFRINFLKSDYPILPRNIMFISWFQDPCIQINSQEHAKKFLECDYDFIFSYSKTWEKEMRQAGYPQEPIFFQVVPVNDQLFYPRKITPEEIEHYGSEVAVVGNNNKDPERLLAEWIIATIARLDSKIAKQQAATTLLRIYDTLQKIIEKGELIATRDQCRQVIFNFCKNTAVTLNEEQFENLAEQFYLNMSYGLHRKIAYRKIIDAGIPLKIWGRYWEDTEFRPFAMGQVSHGDELAKVYSGTKIVIGNCSLVTAHYRVYEALCCGALCLVRNIPPEYDLCDIRDYLTDGQEVVFYDDEDDLIEKIRYYLQHEEERLKIVRNGQKRIKEILTYRVMVENMLHNIKNYLFQ